MVAVGMLIVTLVPIFSTVEAQTRNQHAFQEQAELERGAALAIARLVSDLRQANSSEDSVTAIQQLTPTSITFRVPTRTDPFRMMEVYYRHNGSSLERFRMSSTNDITSTPAPPPWTFPALPSPIPYIAETPGITSITFTGFDALGVATSVLADIRRIDITVQLDIDPAANPAPRTYTVTATLRSTNS